MADNDMVSDDSVEVGEGQLPESTDAQASESVESNSTDTAADVPAVPVSEEEQEAVNETAEESRPEEPVAETDSGAGEGSETDESESDVPAEDSEPVNALGFTAAEMMDDDEEEVDDDGDENASPIEEFVEEEAAVDEELEMKWYILKVQVNREGSICAALTRRVKQAGFESYFGDILVPTEDVREFTKSGKQKIVKRKLYPGYVVVRMAINDDTWFLVRETPGIGDFTGAAGKPAPLLKEEIDRIIATTKPIEEEEGEEPAAIKTAIKFKEGDRVRVKEGYFQNYEGEVSNIDERNGRITVMINIFGRPNPVELDHWQVEDI